VIAAENGATPHQLMAPFGWRTLKKAERYTKARGTEEDRGGRHATVGVLGAQGRN